MTARRRRGGSWRTATVPTAKDVAARAGVSTATVSRVLAGARGVRAELAGRVREAARALCYQPNRVARNLRVRATQTAGVLVPDIENPFFTSLVCGIEEVLQAAGYSLLLANYNEDPDRERIHLNTLRAEGVAGIIFACSSAPASGYQELARARVPLVAISRVPPSVSVDLVTVTNREGAQAAVRHLLALGHRRIGFINGPLAMSTARERQAGYEAAFQGAGLPPPRELMLYADFRQRGGYNAMQTLLSLPAPPSAVFVASNLMTLGALQAIHERGLEIPSDIAVVGFDDMPWAVSLQPPLTAVAQPTRQVGMAAARLLLERIGNPGRAPRHILLDTELIVRASCGARLSASPAAT